MNLKKNTFWVGILASLALGSFGPSHDPASSGFQQASAAGILPEKEIQLDPQFEKYWYKGEAEITSYDLEQARYGELRSGTAAIVFVTEPFSASKQVKLDYADRAGADKRDVLKMNMTKKFVTGIYPYSMMTSTFGDISQGGDAIKVTTSVQEWCGMVFTQINSDGAEKNAMQYSYFESEGDEKLKLGKVLLEDEIWAQIRISPDDLPLGNLQMVPATQYTRLKHKALKAYAAVASMREDGGYKYYTLRYPELDREITIYFNAAFPYEIEGWNETYPEGAGGKKMETSAKLKRRIGLDYWNRNGLEDESLRKEMGL